MKLRMSNIGTVRRVISMRIRNKDEDKLQS